MKKFLLLTTLSMLLLSLQTNGQDLDPSLRFESAITLSNDTAATVAEETTLKKSYTVPFGCVLKITNGRLTSLTALLKYNDTPPNVGYLSSRPLYVTTLEINKNKIVGRSATVSHQLTMNNSTEMLSEIIIDTRNPIWVSQGQEIVLTTLIGSETNTVSGSWINGVVYKITSR